MPDESEMQVKQDFVLVVRVIVVIVPAQVPSTLPIVLRRGLSSCSQQVNCNLKPPSAPLLLLPSTVKWRSAMFVIIGSWDPDHTATTTRESTWPR